MGVLGWDKIADNVTLVGKVTGHEYNGGLLDGDNSSSRLQALRKLAKAMKGAKLSAKFAPRSTMSIPNPCSLVNWLEKP